MQPLPHHTLIGAGPVGTLMALLLAARGHAVRLIERRADPRQASAQRGRSINLAMAARGIVALEQARVAVRIAPAMMPMPGRMLHDERGTLQFLRYGQNPQEIIHALSRERLNRILIEAAAECPGVELRFDTRCLDVDVNAGSVALRDDRSGHTYSEDFEVLLGTDGAGSAVRSALLARGYLQAHEQPLDHDYKELTIPADTRHPGGFAFEPQALHIWPRGGFMLIALPNTDSTFTATLFLARRGDSARGEPGFDHLQSQQAVAEFFETQFADAAVAIPDLREQFATNPQSRLGTLYCGRWQVDGRVLLLGDAAHAIVPFHGQGLNCGFEDCRLLDRLLRTRPASDVCERAALFRQFESERRPDTTAIAAMALENYQEMRDTVRSPQFARRQALAAALERRFPGRFIPRYSMVMFHPEIGYAEAQRRGAAQQRVLDALVADGSPPNVETLLEQAQL
ncbi:MAG TPA: NAD(P)/FAD-dependent oxidoreductase [Steroidobacteraceae bacterium]|nr:NAD(P)/FAD-dependent oxidoreductase [Steroidobacteraceae bacterium]